MMETIYTFND